MKERFRTRISSRVSRLGKKKEQLTGKIRERPGITLAVTLCTIVAVFLLSGGSNPDPNHRMFRVSVGENAWKEPVYVNITDDVEPSTANLEPGETLVWRNQNSFNVTIEIQGVERIYDIAAENSLIFRPSKGFNYVVRRGDERIGDGIVVVKE